MFQQRPTTLRFIHSINLSSERTFGDLTGIQFPHSAPTFLSLFHKCVPIFNDIWDISKLLLLFRNVETNSVAPPIWLFVVYALQKLIEGLNKICLLRVQRLFVMHDIIKPTMVLQPTKFAMQNLVDVLLCGKILNTALVSLNLSSHLHQFLSYQVVLLL